MADNKKVNSKVQTLNFDKGIKPQTIYSESRRIFVKRYLTAKGVRLSTAGIISAEEADRKYGKNLYEFNENAKPIKEIYHQVTTQTKIHLDMIYPKNGVLGRNGAQGQ